ncbi:hypothetical protein IU433_29725 [Nocardia puris]|uniref:Uncharacterized protein n=1 Tax=Nocardia puris TaxID=208602 RepID=A0A366D146_9NOCA|nr:hypothetical protein [Nocardia puris]MBF6215098.1 hypothetical protein [Nocardia puris]MBF6369609.1 hypothetical protein [Nocardia puris]MBF6463184.1 hypothetical protein [Nocardia puris]RBO83666.1 hypothetical protein DFR74_11891 [Nocardia puris]
MRGLSFIRHLTAVAAASALFAGVFSGSATAEPAALDWVSAVQQLRVAAEGNPDAEAAVDRLLAEPERLAEAGEIALPAQPFQVPANSDIGRGQGPGVYGSGIALGIDGFRFGFFGGPGTISPNQTGAKLEVVWLNLANGRSGTDLLIEHQDIPVDTTIRTRVLDTGAGPVVAAVYGSLWHRWSVPVSDDHPDGFQYQLGTISFPSLGAVYN